MLKPYISVIVPIYNVENFIERSLNSLVMQTLSDIEIILVNDGSTDASGDIADAFARKDSRIKVIHQPNCGVSVARNVGIDQANGEYIGFCDPDDWLALNMFERMYKTAYQGNFDIVICDYCLEYEDGTKKVAKQHFLPLTVEGQYNIKKHILPLYVSDILKGGMCNRIYKRSLISKNKIRVPEELDIWEDCVFNWDAFACANSVAHIAEPLYHYRQHNRSSMHRYKTNYFELILKYSKEKEKRMNSWGLNSSYYKSLEYEDFIGKTFGAVSSELSNKSPFNFKQRIVRAKKILSHPRVIEAAKYVKKPVIRKKLIMTLAIFLIKYKKLNIIIAGGLLWNLLKNFKQ